MLRMTSIIFFMIFFAAVMAVVDEWEHKRDKANYKNEVWK